MDIRSDIHNMPQIPENTVLQPQKRGLEKSINTDEKDTVEITQKPNIPQPTKSSTQLHIERLITNIQQGKTAQEQQKTFVEVLTVINQEIQSVERSVPKTALSPQEKVESQIQLLNTLGVGANTLEILTLYSSVLIPTNATKVSDGFTLSEDALLAVNTITGLAVISKLKEQIKLKQSELEELKSTTSDPQQIKNLEKEITALQENLSNNIQNIGFSTATTTLNALSDIFATLSKEASKVSISGKALSIGGSVIYLAQALTLIRKGIADIKNIKSEKIELNKDLKKFETLKEKYAHTDKQQYKAYAHLHTLIDLKLTYVEKLKMTYTTGNLIQQCLNTVSAGKSVASSVCTMLAIKGALVSSLGPAGLVLFAGSLAIGGALSLSEDKSVIANKIRQIPDKLEIKELDRDIQNLEQFTKDINSLISTDFVKRVKSGDKNVLKTFKTMLSNISQQTNKIYKEVETLHHQKETLSHDIDSKKTTTLKEKEKQSTKLKKISKKIEQKESTLQKFSKAQNMLATNIMTFLDNPEQAMKNLGKHQEQEINVLKNKKQTLVTKMEKETQKALIEKEYERLGATEEDITNFKNSLTGVLKRPTTRQVFTEYLKDKIDPKDLEQKPIESIMKYVFEFSPEDEVK